MTDVGIAVQVDVAQPWVWCLQARGNTSSSLSEDPAQFSDGGGMKRSGPQDQERCEEEPKKDLRSRGLCLVPVSFTMHVGSDNGADFWAPALGGGF
ncbi:hypothetical protein C4D60_Mb07t14830 [Musa balbisiana]|uniref:Uncharacterized protein n=1 Tax=Musa balbisiana TaxID=52838 RepID=A0A4S8JFL1_MUSBA|nr:hypothetical protein C4D60_Mb07t14830 [Musa balbisiana]